MKVASPAARLRILVGRRVNKFVLSDRRASARNSDGSELGVHQHKKDEFALRAQFAVTPLRQTALEVRRTGRVFYIVKRAFERSRVQCIGSIEGWNVWGRRARERVKTGSFFGNVDVFPSIGIETIRGMACEAFVETEENPAFGQHRGLNLEGARASWRGRALRRHRRDARMLWPK